MGSNQSTLPLVSLAAVILAGVGWWVIKSSGLDFGQILYLLVGVILMGA